MTSLSKKILYNLEEKAISFLTGGDGGGGWKNDLVSAFAITDTKHCPGVAEGGQSLLCSPSCLCSVKDACKTYGKGVVTGGKKPF